MADMMGMKSGFALDLTTSDEHYKPWDFRIPDRRRAALKMQDDTEPGMLMVSAMHNCFGVPEPKHTHDDGGGCQKTC